MIKQVYCYYNRVGGFYSTPFYLDHDIDKISGFLKYTLFYSDKANLESLQEDDLFYLGTFDTDTASFVGTHEFVMHIGDIATAIIEKKFKKEDDEENGEK